MTDFKRSSSYSRETKKIRKLLNEEAKLGIHHSSDSETEDVDLHGKLYPLSHYMNNREDMIEQMFSIIKGDKLMKMLPPILKDMPLDELKADCLIRLLGMSKKRIIAILEGREINSSSDSETHSDSSSPCGKSRHIVKPIVIKQEGCSDISDNSEEVILIDPDLELPQRSASNKGTKDNAEGSGKSRKRHKKDLQIKNKKVCDKRTKTNQRIQELDIQELDKSEDSQESSPGNANSFEKKVPTEGKTLLEILELEMRARAIRALLHKNDTPEGEENINAPEKQCSSSGVSVETETKTSKVTPVRKFRKKKRKSDDVIVITPKVVTIDLTDENDPCSAKKKTKESIKDKKLEHNLYSSTKDDAPKEVETTNESTVNQNNEICDLTEVEIGLAEVDKEKERTKNTELVVSLELSSRSSEHSNLENMQKTGQQKSNWAQRWLESKEVKKVVSTSKICGNIRKRIKNAKLAKQNQGELQKVEVKSQEIQGSVDEYQLLSKSSNVPDSNAPSGPCHSEESSSISNEGDSGKQLETESKEACSSVEQVQDVSSTKSETPTGGNICEENILGDSNQENIRGDSNITIFEDGSSHSRMEPDDTNVFDSKQSTSESKNIDSTALNVCALNTDTFVETNVNNSELEAYNNLKSKSPQQSHTEFKDKQSELNSVNSSEEIVVHSALSDIGRTDTPVSESVPSSETGQSQLIAQSCDQKMELLQSNRTTNSDVDEEISESNADIVSSVSAVEFCHSKSNPCDIIKSPSQLNEPETLEINITDEDRNIDGILDEKSELDSRNTALRRRKVIEID